jgi:hypothetical protein
MSRLLIPKATCLAANDPVARRRHSKRVIFKTGMISPAGMI